MKDLLKAAGIVIGFVVAYAGLIGVYLSGVVFVIWAALKLLKAFEVI